MLVLNGKSGISGVAGTVTETVKAAGYTTLDPTNGPAHAQTTVYAAASFEGDCQRLAQFVATSRNERVLTSAITAAITQEVPTASNADCVVVIGKPQAATTTTA